MWDYLDKMNHNLLYKYAAVLSGKRRTFYSKNAEKDESVNAEEKKKNVCYLIWFVYRYILQCRTLEETIPYQNEEILKKYKLSSFFINNAVFICNDEIYFRKKKEDIAIILEILYGRYTLWEQFDCFIRNTTGVRRKRCIAAKEKYWNIYQDYLKKEEKRKEGRTDEMLLEEMFRGYGSVI